MFPRLREPHSFPSGHIRGSREGGRQDEAYSLWGGESGVVDSGFRKGWAPSASYLGCRMLAGACDGPVCEHSQEYSIVN